MKKHLPTILLVILLLGGLGLLLYPTLSDWWNSMHQSRAIQSYQDSVKNLSGAETERLWKAAEDYNRKLAQKGGLTKLTEPELEEYQDVLDVTGTGIMGYLEIPSIHVSLPIYHGTNEAVLQIAVGHLEGSSLPVGGASTHAVLSGHRGLPSAKLLTDLDQMVEGDLFSLRVLGEDLTYLVDQIRIVLPEEVDGLAVTPGQDYVTLVTCTPYGINTHRLLVRGHRVAGAVQEAIVTADAMQVSPVAVAAVIGLPILLACMLLALLVTPGRRSKRAKR